MALTGCRHFSKLEEQIKVAGFRLYLHRKHIRISIGNLSGIAGQRIYIAVCIPDSTVEWKADSLRYRNC